MAACTLAGPVWWVTVGLDRSGTIAALPGYPLAGGHVFVFALRVWLGPMLWTFRTLTQ